MILDKLLQTQYPQYQILPAMGAFSITPNDSADQPYTTRSIYIGGGGNLKVTFSDGSVATFVGLPAGTDWPWRVNRIWATGTTCTNLIGLY